MDCPTVSLTRFSIKKSHIPKNTIFEVIKYFVPEILKRSKLLISQSKCNIDTLLVVVNLRKRKGFAHITLIKT